PVFVIKAFEKTENASVPIQFSVTSERLKDYVALKAIWEALDGPHWNYHGEAEQAGANWNFNKDMDLWGEQPGVSLDEDGRVSAISLIGMGAKGVVPDEIGQLTALRVLYLGAHDETLGSLIAKDLKAISMADLKTRARESYETHFLKSDVRNHFSEPLREFINKDTKQRPILESRISLKDVQMGYLTNRIEGISRAIKRCNGMEQIYLANSPITSEGFFRDVDPASPYYDETAQWENFESLTDIEIYNCPKLTSLPMEMLAHLPELQLLNVASNPGISGAQLKADWEALIDGTCGEKVQVIYMGFNNLEETPSYDNLKRMKKLSAIDLGYNKLRTVHPFGKGINLVKLYLNNNQLTEIPAAPDGYFSDFQDVEIMSFAFNQLTVVPDIFNARSNYIIDQIDFSHNNITALEHDSLFAGFNAYTVDLSYNRFERMPKGIITSGSPISYLIMSGNGMTEIPKGTLTGKNSSNITSLDFSLNKLKELPEDFRATNMPYLYGVDLSGNQFEEIPQHPLNSAYLTVLILRNQRDAAGNRTLKTWLTGIYQHPCLTALYLGGNDLRKIDDTISPNIRVFEIKDNPNICIDMSGVCAYIEAGYYQLFYDKTQDIRGCSALGIE
ncbi:MAG: hypothetical protein HUK03_01330, partial [Bacteroidaceae bacterium]|nr:hypothetical protein [Bacteroidaceae bacterium]